MRTATATALYNALRNASAVTDIATGGVWDTQVAQGTAAPYVIMTEIYSEIPTAHVGAADSQMDAVQLTSFAQDSHTARQLRDAVRDTLEAVALSTGDVPSVTDERSDFEPQANLHRADLDVMI